MDKTPHIDTIAIENDTVMVYARKSDKARWSTLVGECSIHHLARLLEQHGYTLTKIIDNRTSEQKLIDAIWGKQEN